MKALLSNKLLLGVVVAIIGIAGVLFAPKPFNSISLLVMFAGIGIVAYTVVIEKRMASAPASASVAVPSA